MSEYIEIETEIDDDDLTMRLNTNLKLAEEGAEIYDSPEAMEEGSPVAQALAPIDGLRRLTIEGRHLVVIRDADAPWHNIVSDISAALKDFFL
jgi:hypothetical protein